jgi:TPR repeat protein
MYMEGQGVAKDYQEAVRWALKAAGQGYADAQFALGGIYATGDDGFPQDFVVAFQWWHKAADQGHVSAQRALAELLREN